MSIKVVVIGDVSARLTAHTERLPRPHQTVSGWGFAQMIAGHGALQAVAAARLGADVSFVGAVGADVNSAFVREQFSAEGIDTTYLIEHDSAPTGVFLGFSGEDHKAMYAAIDGANNRLSEQHVEAATQAITEADVLVTQFAVPLGAVRRALQIAGDADVLTVVKPTPFSANAAPLVRLPSVITPNDEELRSLAQHADQTEVTPDQMTVCTLGRAGAQWFHHHDGRIDTGRVDGFQVRAIDPTGAGNVFSAALAVALAEAQPLTDAIRFANAAGALTTTVHGGWTAAPARDAVLALLAKHPLPQNETS